MSKKYIKKYVIISEISSLICTNFKLKMNKSLTFLCLTSATVFMASCSNVNKSINNEGNTNKISLASNPLNTNNTNSTPLIGTYAKIIGSYVGEFGSNKMTLLISNFKGDTVLGRSIVAMNDRPFEGTITYNKGVFNIDAKEPGDNKYDGVFHITLEENQLDKLQGFWEANNKSTPNKRFVFERKSFSYDATVGSYAEASERLLKTTDVENLTKEELFTMRNNIFARHGYVFYKKDTRDMYEKQTWYIPNSIDVKNDLTDIEKKNIALIARYEKYAIEYGEDFGR